MGCRDRNGPPVLMGARSAAFRSVVTADADGSLILVDLDATIVVLQPGRRRPPPLEKTYRFHPLAAFAGHGADAGGSRWPSRHGAGTRVKYRQRAHRGGRARARAAAALPEAAVLIRTNSAAPTTS
jgi:hypothetical protein